MPKVYLSPYTAGPLNRGEKVGCRKSYEPLHMALRHREWPFDYGDDPSFFCRDRLGGALTWGVCRADVRNQVKPGDVVVFFAFTKTDEGTEYRLSAIATVEKKIRQSDIYSNRAYREYRRYLNLLVKPADRDGKRWIHHEPGAPEHDWHKDWLSRVVPFRVYPKAELDRQGSANEVQLCSQIGGKPFQFGANYVIFAADSAETVVLKKPPVVANAEPPGAELWLNNRQVRKIFRHTLGEAQRYGVKRSLRLADKRFQPHSPPVRWELTVASFEKWRSSFVRFIVSEGRRRPNSRRQTGCVAREGARQRPRKRAEASGQNRAAVAHLSNSDGRGL